MTTAAVPPGRHDPEGRRRQIIHATADLIPEVGTAKLTHRLIAERAGVSLGSMTRYFATLDELIDEAVALIAAELDAELAQSRERIAVAGCTPEVLTKLIGDYLDDQEDLGVTAAMFAAGVAEPRLRPLAAQWSNGMAETLTQYTSAEAAQAIVLIMDGATLHAVLGQRPSNEVLRAAFAGLLNSAA